MSPTRHADVEPASLTSVLLSALATFAATGLLMWLLFGFLARNGQLIYVWPLTGVQLGLLLHATRTSNSRRVRWAGIAGGALALLLASLVLHAPLLTALSEALLQSAELGLLLRLLRGHIRCLDDLKRRTGVLRLLAASVAVPAVIALILQEQHPGWRACSTIILADSLGLVVFVPVVLLLCSGRLQQGFGSQKNRPVALLGFLFLIGTALGVFGQNTNPILFLLFPSIMLVVFMLGIEGACLASFATTLISCTATAHHHGPIWIARGISVDHRILVLQLFILTVSATSLPVGALLDQRRTAERHARQNESIYQTLLANSEDMIILSRLDGTSRFVSPAVRRITGWTPEEYTSLPHTGGIHPEDVDLARSILTSLSEGKVEHSIRYRALHKEGTFRWVEAFVRGFADEENGPITGYVATVHDISLLKETEDCWSAEKRELARENAQLATLAERDELTGISNRRCFNRALTMEAARQNRSSDSLSLLMIDVDFFKKYNDRYGHHAGDLCLQKVARVFERSVCRLGDLAARIGGEEFAILLPQTDAPGAMQVARLVLEGIRRLQLEHEDNPGGIVTVSIGVATCLPQQQTESAQLIQQADRALYESKHSGRNRCTEWVGVREMAGPALRLSGAAAHPKQEAGRAILAAPSMH